MMTRKHFEMIAKLNADLISTYGQESQVIISMAMRQCFAFKEENVNFNSEKFLLASGFTAGEAVDIALRIR